MYLTQGESDCIILLVDIFICYSSHVKQELDWTRDNLFILVFIEVFVILLNLFSFVSLDLFLQMFLVCQQWSYYKEN